MAQYFSNLTPYQLGELGVPEALPFLRAYLKSHVINDVRLAASAVGKIAINHAADCRFLVPDLIRALNTNKSQVVQYVINTLTKIPFSADADTLVLFAKISRNHTIPTTRAQAAYLMNPTGKPPSTPVFSTSPAAPLVSTRAFNLTGEQRRILTLPPSNPILIKGVAGSGKTTLAILRAKQLSETGDTLFRQSNIHIFAYTKSLIKFIEGIIGPEGTKPSGRITISTLHSWIWSFLKEAGILDKYSVARRGQPERIIGELVVDYALKHSEKALFQKPKAFFTEEIKWMKGSGLLKKQEYLDRPRLGRGTSDRVTSADKELIWALYLEYWKFMQKSSLIDFDDFVLHALKIIDSNPDFVPPFSHIVIDEAQDLSASQIRLMTKLVSPETKSITLIADAAQRIYKSGFSWRSVGIDIRGVGRSIELKHNYRNTQQIAEAAISLLAKDPQPEEFTAQIAPIRVGPVPQLVYSSSSKAQLRHITTLISRLNCLNECIIILHRTVSGCEALLAELRTHGIYPNAIYAETTKQIHAGVYVCTMNSIKGLECDHIILADLNDHLLPLSAGFTEANDDLQICTERRLLYTCMTRARSTLTMITTGQPSRYLSEIDPAKVEVSHAQ